MDPEDELPLLEALYIEQPEWIFSDTELSQSTDCLRGRIISRAVKYFSAGKPVYSSGILPEKIRRSVRFLGEDSDLSSVFAGYRTVEVGGAHLYASKDFIPEDAAEAADLFRGNSPLVYMERCVPAVCSEIAKGGSQPIINTELCLGGQLDRTGDPLPGTPYPCREIKYLGGDYSLGAYFGLPIG